jgi:sec-independent protein translocase protein TatB
MTPTPTIELASFGMWDSLILMVMALVVFGPRRLPEIGRQIGKLMYEVRKASNDFKFQMEDELRKAEETDRRKKEEEQARAQAAAVALPSEAAPAATGVESPYPGEAVYPVVSPAEFQQDEPYPRIHLPSTGEPVAAARPGNVGVQIDAPPVGLEAAQEELPTVASEPAATDFSTYRLSVGIPAETSSDDTTPSSERSHNG